jgi:predicted ATPase/class 3 adenylate cyclase
MSASVFVMSDVVGSTALWETHGDDMRSSLLLHDQIVHTAMEAAGGRVFKHTGDGMIAVFDEADPAADAALAAVEALADANWGPTGPLAIRVAVHAGEVTPRGDDFFGPPLNKLARINAAGSGGQVLMSDAVRHLLRTPTGRDLGEHQLKDLGEPVHLWQLDNGHHTTLRTLVTTRHNLPRQNSAFISRERELKELTDLVEQNRLVTMTGVGGCGKTRLAIEVAATLADNFDGGVWFVDLSTERTDERVAIRTLDALGVSANQDGSETDTVELVRQATNGQRTLMIVDNCEHLIDATADLVDELLTRLDSITVLATSREALSVDGERVWRIPSLTVGSVELFLARSQSSGADDINEHLSVVEEICSSLDHIPLAIELAAAQTAFMSVPELAQHLEDRFALLGGSRRARRQRQQTLTTMMEWSWDLLSEAEARLLSEISVLRSPFSLDGIVGVSSEPSTPAVMDALRGLVAQSLVVPEPSIGRYRLLETVRLFALDRLVASNTIRVVRDRQVAWARRCFGITGLDDTDWTASTRRIREIYEETAEIFAALDWADQNDDLDALRDLLYGGSWAFVVDRASDGVAWLARVPLPAIDDDIETLDRLVAEVYPNYFSGRFAETLDAAGRATGIVEKFRNEGRLREIPFFCTTPVFFTAALTAWTGDFVRPGEMIDLIEDWANEVGEPRLRMMADAISVDLGLRADNVECTVAAMRRLDAYPDEAKHPAVGMMQLFYGTHLALRQGQDDRALDLLDLLERDPALTPEAWPQLLELECRALVGLGRLRDTLDALRRPVPPMLDYQRDIRRASAALSLAVLYGALGDADGSTVWAEWCRRLSNPMSWLYRKPALTGLVDLDLAEPNGVVDPAVRVEFDAEFDAALDELELRLG